MTQNPTPTQIAKKTLASAGLTTARDFAILGPEATPSTGFRGRSRTLTPDDLAAFIDLGFDTSDQIKELWVAGVSPEDVSEYQKLGIDSSEGIKRANAAGVTPKVAKDFQEKGVYDLNDMLAMKKSKIGASTLKAYHRLEDFTGEDAERLKNAGASAALVNAAVSTGIKTVDAVISVAKAGVKGNDILVVSLGYTVEEAIILIKSFGGFNVGDAYKNISAWHELGVKGYEALVEMKDSRLGLEDAYRLKAAVGAGWQEWTEATKIDRRMATVLAEAGASLELALWIIKFQGESIKSSRRYSDDSWGYRQLEVAFKNGYTPDEIRAYSEKYPYAPSVFPDSEPTEKSDGRSYRAPAIPMDRALLDDALRIAMSYDSLLGYVQAGATGADQADELRRLGWTYYDFDRVLQAGFTYEDALASPLVAPAEEEINVDEVAESDASRTTAPSPEDWDWDDAISE